MKDTRGRIVSAAAGLIAEKGFKRTSVDDVIERADLSGKSHFYHYFKSKEELGLEVLGRQFESFAERGLVILREPLIHPMERLHLFIDSLVALQTERGFRVGSPFGTLATEMADLHEGFRERLVQVFDRWAAQIEALLWEARPMLNPDADTRRLARFLIATLEGALMMSKVNRDAEMLRAIAADLKRFVSSHLREGVPA
ncbi:MAG: TetR family transcriptional regulator C-terminal domain-containing protein [Gemmatimonadetes bacterium]|nr:TetR family transcriptional regulator C-terminal domain-containing protein [Gemmatimonadota bacterium]